ncbi:MAG: hypothetical protein ABSD59_16845 [Terracidiphilus sp.]
MATMQPDVGGRFSADLPEGQDVLQVWAPEIGESSLPVAVSELGDSTELKIKLDAAPFGT